MAITQLKIRSRAAFAEGHDFGESGPYEQVNGVLHLAVRPTHPANRAITGLDKRPRDAEGCVHFPAGSSDRTAILRYVHGGVP